MARLPPAASADRRAMSRPSPVEPARDEADGTDIRLENGVVVRTEPGNRVDGRGADRGDDRRCDDGVADDNSNSGPGSGGGHAVEDDSNRGAGSGGHGADDPPGDDHGGRSGSDG